jgi:cell filamentation protein, protein adenylyltransferase
MAAIHPFGDGNGRTARVLSSLAMYRGGFQRREFTSLEEWWGRHLDDYYRAFECLGSEFDRSVDVTPFIEMHVRAQLSQVRSLDMRERAERRVWTILEDLAEEIGLPRRVANGLWDAFFGREVTAGYYRSLSDVSPQTATNDLTAASASGLLRAVGAKRGRKYLPGDRLYAEIARILEVPVTEPGETLRAAVLSELSRRTAAEAEPIPLSSPSEN